MDPEHGGPPPDAMPLLRIDSELARELADRVSVLGDLTHVLDACTRLITMLRLPEEQQDGVLMRAYWTSALVAYVRCFGGGVRRGIDPGIFAELPGEPIATHQHYKDTRNRHVAHAVNAFEEVRVGVFVGETGEVVGVGHMLGFKVTDSEEGVRMLGRLAAHARRWVTQEVDRLTKEVREEARRLSPDDLEQLRNARIQPSGGARQRRR